MVAKLKVAHAQTKIDMGPQEAKWALPSAEVGSTPSSPLKSIPRLSLAKQNGSHCIAVIRQVLLVARLARQLDGSANKALGATKIPDSSKGPICRIIEKHDQRSSVACGLSRLQGTPRLVNGLA